MIQKSEVERELDEELHQHIERQTEQNIRLGMSPEEARDTARKAFGGVEQAKERSRDARGVRWLAGKNHLAAIDPIVDRDPVLPLAAVAVRGDASMLKWLHF